MAVFPGRRIRDNNVFGTLSALLANEAGPSTMQSDGLALLSAVASNHAVLVLDPLRTAGAPEIVVVTAHTGAATTATVTRGAYGTAPRQHAAGTLWVLATTADDLIRLVADAAGRPSDQYILQLIGRQDSKTFEFHNGTDWSPMQGGGTLGYGEAGAVNQGTITTEVDVTGATATVTVGTGRRVKLTGQISVESTVANDEVTLQIKQDGVRVKLLAMTLPVANRGMPFPIVGVETPTAGAHTYKLTVQRTIGTGIITVANTSDRAAFMLVEDIGV